MTSLRVLFTVLAVLGAVQAAPRGHCPGGGDRGSYGKGEVESVGSNRPSHTNGTAPMPTITGDNGDASIPNPNVDGDDVEEVVPSGTSTGLPTPSGASQAIINNTLLDTGNSDCKCGYVMSAYNDAYFPYHHSTSFTGGPEGPISSVNSLSAYKLRPSAEGQSMGVAGDAVAVQSLSNIRINNGVLELVVPGGQTGGEIKSAELTFDTVVTGGVFTMDAKIDDTPGTCQSIFTYHEYIEGDNTKHDEQDIELLGTSLLQDTANAPKGIQLTNHNPAAEGPSDFKINPYANGVDPVNDFHKYTIAWVPGGTQYTFDGTVMDGPTQFSSVNPSNIVLNHWSSASEFTNGPPTQDVVMGVRSLEFYYATKEQQGLLSGCTMEQACRV